MGFILLALIGAPGLGGSLGAAASGIAVQETAAASPTNQVTTEGTATSDAPPIWISPTPDETGAITVVVQPGESLWVIAARAGLTLPELLALNGLTEADIINPGDVILIARVTPVAVSPEEGTPTATPPPPTPRPTEAPREAALCLSAYNDRDQDGEQDADEPLRPGVAFTLYNTEAVVANYITDGVSEPKCLRGLLPGEYRVTRSIAPGETLTTPGDWTVNLSEGRELHQAFGSFLGATLPAGAGIVTATPSLPTAAALTPAPPLPSAPAPLPSASSTSPSASGVAWRIAGVAALFAGGLLLLGAVLILLFRQRTSTTNREPDPAEGERRFRNIDDLD
jgi:LysM repeat protein